MRCHQTKRLEKRVQEYILPIFQVSQEQDANFDDVNPSVHQHDFLGLRILVVRILFLRWLRILLFLRRKLLLLLVLKIEGQRHVMCVSCHASGPDVTAGLETQTRRRQVLFCRKKTPSLPPTLLYPTYSLFQQSSVGNILSLTQVCYSRSFPAVFESDTNSVSFFRSIHP